MCTMDELNVKMKSMYCLYVKDAKASLWLISNFFKTRKIYLSAMDNDEILLIEFLFKYFCFMVKRDYDRLTKIIQTISSKGRLKRLIKKTGFK